MAFKKALVCDDSSTDLENIRTILQQAGCEVITAMGGREALAKAQRERPDIIFMDIVMPDLDGYETCRLLSEDPETMDIPVVFVSSRNQHADRVWAQMQGGKDLVSKPFQPEQIVGHLGKV